MQFIWCDADCTVRQIFLGHHFLAQGPPSRQPFPSWVYNCLLFPKVEQPQFIWPLLVVLGFWSSLVFICGCCWVTVVVSLCSSPSWAWSPSCIWWLEQRSPPPAPARFHLKGVLCTILTELQTVFWLFPQSQHHLKSFSVLCHLRPFSNTGNLNILSSMVRLINEDGEHAWRRPYVWAVSGWKKAVGSCSLSLVVCPVLCHHVVNSSQTYFFSLFMGI